MWFHRYPRPADWSWHRRRLDPVVWDQLAGFAKACAVIMATVLGLGVMLWCGR